MNTYQLPRTHIDDSAWSQALYAFLAEKEQRSGSRRTVESYSRMLQDFFGRVGKTPDLVTSSEVLAYAHGIGKSVRQPPAITIGAGSPASMIDDDLVDNIGIGAKLDLGSSRALGTHFEKVSDRSERACTDSRIRDAKDGGLS
jgi:hypothetical protein